MLPIDEMIDRIGTADREDRLRLLEVLLNGLHREGLVSRHTLTTLAADVMLLDYREDEDLLCFNCMDHELHDA